MISYGSSCTMFGTRTTLLILRRNAFFIDRSGRRFSKFVPRFTVSASLSSVLTSGNVIAAAAAAGSGPVHGAVTSAITHLAVTAVAIASGACLSTKVDFLWPKAEEQPGCVIVEGVDVTGYPIFKDIKVEKAIAFARKAHQGQMRKTGDPYITHCIHTGKILAALVPTSGKRAVDTVVAGILHDVVDDTSESFSNIEKEFDADVAMLVAGVSRLSYINQLLRRHRRINVSQATLSHEEANNLRVMLLGMVDDPRVVLIKLADRLHNMRTIYALPIAKAEAVAQETLAIWCSLASRLGLWALKAELEDLCFAVYQPQIFQRMRADLALMWSVSNMRKSDAKRLTQEDEECRDEEEHISMKVLLEAVLPFDVLSDRKKRVSFLNNVDNKKKAKVVQDASIALSSLVLCEEALERELLISTSYVPGMEVTLSSRLKSLYSIYNKMKRKDVDIDKVYDARALRVIVGDKNGALHGQAVQSCYNLLDIVHRFWTPIDGEFDDYIVNPKPSGYQSLHTAVQGPESSPLEVQIRTQRMHEYAEHGLAAHWLYKETADSLPCSYNNNNNNNNISSSSEEEEIESPCSLKPGHPVVRVEAGHLLTAVIIKVEKGGRELLVAAGFGLATSEGVADRRCSNQIKKWEAYAGLYKKVSDQWWFEPGHGDWCTNLEKYTLSRDGIFHKEDHFQRLLPTYIQVIELTEEEENEYWDVVSAVFENKPLPSSNTSLHDRPTTSLNSTTISSSSSMENNDINNKIYLLRTMLKWEEELRTEASLMSKKARLERKEALALALCSEVVIVCWPNGEIMRLTNGSTAADAARKKGLDGKLVSVNGHLVLPSTQLKDGDVVEVKF